MDSYRIVTTNPDFKKVRFEPYEMNPGFVSYRGSRILTLKDSFRIVSHESMIFQRIACFYKSNKSLRILSTIAQNESLSFGLANPNLKDLYRGFVSWIHFWKIRFVDSFPANQNLKLLNSFRFVRICIPIPHPDKYLKLHCLCV